ncbi:unnamed protein product [Adineta ricciae]|uniref:MHD domain-containing protein n=1 Tax=Adineta ricciae TaxID=249248 RepID=A0A814G983_ADIRI|nr:unnamed protein product [Adineta ricciae]
MVLWGEAFWSEGNRGLEVLSTNVKNGAIAIDEFQRFLSESVQCETSYCKNLARLQSQLLKTQYVGTYTPIWILIRDLIDKISSVHGTTVNLYQELLRDVHIHQETFQKKVKSHIQKDVDITSSADLMSQLGNALHTVNKAKEQFQSIAFDYERTKRGGHSTSNNQSTPVSQDTNVPSLAQSALHSFTARQSDRLEKKYRQAQDEYKSTIDKYNKIRSEYQTRFYNACTKFQDFEIDHIEKLLAYSLTYSDILQRYSEQIRTAQIDFTARLKSLTGSDLLDIFVEQKKTGTEPPVALQFEEVDSFRASISPLPPSIADASTPSDDFNLFEQTEPNAPAIQANFPIPATPTKTIENSRASLPSTPSNQVQTSPNNAIMPPPMNHQTTSGSPVTSTSATVQSQEKALSNENPPNPFDLKIRKPKFPGFFGSGRREKKDKKVEKSSSFTVKSRRAFQTQNSREEPAGRTPPSSQNEFKDIHASINENDEFSSSKHKSTDLMFDSLDQYEAFIAPNDSQQKKSSSKVSTNSSDSSDDDDDDDNLMLKINVKINPKSETPIDTDADDDHAKIMNAMRLIDKNIGTSAATSRVPLQKNLELNRSTANELTGIRPLPPPPLPSRSTITKTNSISTEGSDQLNMFPPQKEFDLIPWDRINPSSVTNQDDAFLSPETTTIDNKNSTSLSSNEDDSEVANSFFNDNFIPKTSQLPVSQTPSLVPSDQQQSALSPANTPAMAPVNINFRNSPLVSHEQGMSPLTVGATDQIPLAVAFQETIHVMMSGNNRENWKSRIVGEMLISFPASILTLLNDPVRFANALQFQLKNLDNVDKINVKSPPITENESIYSFDMSELHDALRSLHEKTPSSRFFNLNVLNYEVNHADQANIPIEITSQWSRTFDTISVNISYRFNSSFFPDSIRFNNETVIFYTIIADGEQIKESLPAAEWSANEHKLWWKVPYVKNGAGNLCATVITMQAAPIENETDNEQSEQPLTTSSIINAYFIGENALFSAIDIDLTSRGYRVSLLKKKVLSGKYQAEPDQSEPIHLFQRPNRSPSSTD